jgi:predicted phage terminase large subunit-like protein
MRDEILSLTPRQFALEERELRDYIRGAVSAFPDDTAEKKTARVRRAREDRQYFFDTYLPHYFTDPPAPMHAEMDRLLDVREDPVAVAAARGFSKSTRVSFGNPLHAICYELRHFIILVQATGELAAPMVRAIRIELEENARIRSDFGDLKGQPWGDDDLTTRTGIKVLARGKGQAIRGIKHGPHRPDLIILDDLEEDQDVRNPATVKRLLQWVREAVMGALDPHRGSLMWIGTLLSKRSALAIVLADAAWVHAWFPGENTDGTPAWAARFSAEVLARMKRKMGSVAYNKEILLDAPDDEALFKESWIVRYRKADIAGQVHVVKEVIDPSLGRNETSDFRAFVKGGRSQDGYLYVRRPDITRRSLDSIVQVAYARQLEEPAGEILLGETGFLGLELYFRSEGERRGMHLPLRMLKETEAKETRVAKASPLVERGILRFLAEDPMTDLLIEQLLAFPSTTVNDDGPDALAHLADALMLQVAAADAGSDQTERAREEAALAGPRAGRWGRHAVGGLVRAQGWMGGHG